MSEGPKAAVVRIAMWSGPRTISTALMRAFENRADTAVWDEPFYAHYLDHTGLDHPMAADIIAAYERDWCKVVALVLGPPPGEAHVFFQKHMSHHMLSHLGLDWLNQVANCFLIRDPARVASSYGAKRGAVRLEDLGFAQQLRLFETVRGRSGRIPPVIDAEDVLAAPEAVLPALCGALGIDFDPAMLSWPAGRRASDGLWGAHWYGAVAQSTGFAPARRDPPVVPPELKDIVAAARPIYEALFAHRLAG